MRQGETAPGSDQAFPSAFVGSPVGMSLTQLDGTLSVNPAFAQLLGYSEAELRGMRWKDITHPDDLAKSEEVVASLLAGTVTNAHFQKRYLHRSGATVWADVRTTLCRDIDGQPPFFVTSVVDVTSHRQAGMETLLQNVLLKTMQEALLDGVLVVDAENRVLTHNRRFLEICRIPVEVAATGSDRRLLDQAAKQVADPEGFLARISWLYDHPRATGHDEIDLVDGRVLERYSAPLLSEDGRELGRVWLFRDITDTRRAETVLGAQLDELQRWQEVMLDREDRVAALKREVNELCGHLGQPARYPSQLASVDAASEHDLKTTTDLLRHAGRNPGENGDQGT